MVRKKCIPYRMQPRAHAVPVVAPLSGPVLVIDPAGQIVHAVTFDAVEYRPASHALHVVAPADAPVLVIDPAAQSVHSVTSSRSSVPLSTLCRPTAHGSRLSARAAASQQASRVRRGEHPFFGR